MPVLPGVASFSMAMGCVCVPLCSARVATLQRVAVGACISTRASGCCWGCRGFLTICHLLGGAVRSRQLFSHAPTLEEVVLWFPFLQLAHRGVNSHGVPCFCKQQSGRTWRKMQLFPTAETNLSLLLPRREDIAYLCSRLSCFYPRDRGALTAHLRKPRAEPGLPLPRHLAAIQQTIAWACRILSQRRPREASRPRGGRGTGLLSRAVPSRARAGAGACL